LSIRTPRSSSPEPAPGGAAWPRPARPRLPGWLAYRLQRALAPNAAYRRLAGVLARSPAASLAFTAAERATKSAAFGCRMCGQCTLPVTGYACPASCPKQLRNGPCGGVGADGSCEVFPDTRCVWVVAYERAQREGRVADLLLLQRPVDHRRSGQSAWISYWRGDDESLWAAPGTPALGTPAPGATAPGATAEGRR
jgi:hypothetical protein